MAEGAIHLDEVAEPTIPKAGRIKIYNLTGTRTVRAILDTGQVVYLTPETLNNYTATAAPNPAIDDVTLGYGVGSHWYDVTNDEFYVCLDPADGAAVWRQIAYV